MKICFATNNDNKLREVSRLLGASFFIVSPAELGHTAELAETGDTLQANALQKAQFIHQKFHIDCFADDTGLEVAALDGAPGVRSARYAGEARSNADNISLLLHNLSGKQDRQARFRTVMALYWKGRIHYFEGIVRGYITEEMRGSEGFGYDPVFVPEGHTRTFAEMTMEEKNEISHRARAMRQLVSFLKEQNA
jgi:XTP/dITP diphosphohydrolase